jgi:riboflavin synthase
VDFDIAAETVARTTLGEVRTGAKVNLERALRLGAGLDGHLVQGHVDGVGEVRRIDRAPDQWTVEFSAPSNLTDEMVEKGSVAVCGVSLTITAVRDGLFGVALIPTTWKVTTFGDMSVGSKVNIETDVIGKYIRRYLWQIAGASGEDGGPAKAGGPGGLTIEKLRNAGFM